ncbi:Hypothetical predicted protein [Olea europaea subsp. europaea]|uniref:Uncharacterized protein n=1 Tax=Olea europaea subsp. europaea TaxID=158383 RepID=A0A8S0TXD8_OLEEU|nr:Hypothetical predicted protein [Olea europaea subsp. europaea]
MRNHNQQQLHQLKSKSKSLSLPERRGVGSGLDDGAAPSKTNLDRFLKYTTPAVVAQCYPETSVRGWRNRDSEFHPYFVLGDLWDSFREWSVYGAEVPLLLNGNDYAVQYYVPYCLLCNCMKPGEGSDADSSLETNSDESSHCDPDRGANNTRGTWNRQNTTGTDWPQFHVSPVDEQLKDAGISPKLSLPTFGLASCKFKVNDWNAEGVDECQKFDSLV